MAVVAATLVPTMSVVVVHAALFMVMGVGIGVGSVVGKIGLTDMNPIVFALLRDGIAAPILLVWAFLAERAMPTRRQLCWIAGAAVCLFLSNICYTIGVKLSNAVIGAAWQASAPIFTTFFAIITRLEHASRFKLVGIAIAFAGALFLILLEKGSDSENTKASSAVLGNLLFLVNVSAYSTYTLLTKPLLKEMGPITLTGVAFVFVTGYLAVAEIVVRASPVLHKAVCDECGDNDWNVPTDGIWALAYFILVYSVALYSVMAWANQYVLPSTVNAYAVFQPVAAAVLELILVQSGYTRRHPDVDLTEPGWNGLGALGILFGLGLLLLEDYRMFRGVKADSESRSSLLHNEQ